MEGVTPLYLFWQLPRSALDSGVLQLYERSYVLNGTIPVSSICYVTLGSRDPNGCTAVNILLQSKNRRTFLFDSGICAKEFLLCAIYQLGGRWKWTKWILEGRVRGIEELEEVYNSSYIVYSNLTNISLSILLTQFSMQTQKRWLQKPWLRFQNT